jgi:triacylglycerol lipase
LRAFYKIFSKINFCAEKGNSMSEMSDRLRREWFAADIKRDAKNIIPDEIERFSNILYGENAIWQVLDVYRPKCEKKILPVIVSFHGGGWIYGSKENYQYYGMELAKQGFAVINFTYRLAPETKFPGALEDMNKVIFWMYENAEKYGFDLHHIFAVGDSAGAHLLGLYCAICTNSDYAKNFAFKVPHGFRPSAIAMNCGIYKVYFDDIAYNELDEELKEDFQLMTISLPDHGSDRERYLVNVLEHITPEFPPAYIMTCVGDTLAPQAPMLTQKYKEKNIYCESVVYGDEFNPLYHVFHLNVNESIGKKCNEDECGFFRRMMKK